MMTTERRLALLAAGCGLALVLAYVPDSGHGFVKDDFRWLAESRVRSVGDLGRLFTSDNGFYRPVVSLSFAVDELLFGAWARGYALTNFAILLLCCWAMFALARSLTMGRGTALFAVALWALNPHGISGLVMWISGRTSGLVTLFSLLAAHEIVRGRRLRAAALCLVALLSKEEAFLLPVVLMVWAGWSFDSSCWSWRRAWVRGWPAVLTLVPYLVLRSQTRAFGPTTAPAYYSPTFNPLLLGRNVLEYADRSATFATAVILLLLLAVRRIRRLESDERRWVLLGVTWLVGGFSVSIFVPTRSSLYVCLPSVGVALAGAAIAQTLWSQASPRVRGRLIVAAAIVPFALVPLLHSRNARARRAADLSATVVAQVKSTWPTVPPGGTIILEDDARQRPNLREAFGTLLEPAIALEVPGGLGARVDYVPAPDGWTQARIRVPGGQRSTELRFRLLNGRLVPSD